ncbi:MAG: uroporphyrinogen-III C-methyltransferase [Succinivibrio sp.]
MAERKQDTPSSPSDQAGADKGEQERIDKLNAEVQAIEEQARIMREGEKRSLGAQADPAPSPKEARPPREEAAVEAAPARLHDAIVDRDIRSLRARTAFLGVLVLIAIALCVGGALYFSQDLSKAVSASDALRLSSEQSSARAEKVLDAFSAQGTRVDQLLEANATLQKDSESLRATVDSLEKRLAAAEGSLESANSRLKRYEERNPDDWKIAQAYFLVSSAFRMAVFSDDLTSALWCLKDADSMLEGIEDPDVIKVRQAISSDTVKLSGIPSVDRRGISFKIDSVYSNIDAMPVEDMARKSVPSKKSDPQQLGWKDNLMNTFERFTSRFIEIRRRNEDAVNRFLSPDQAGILRQNIRSLLLLAKQALFQGDQNAYRNNIEQARGLITSYFDGSADAVRANIAALDSISGLQVSVDAPSVLSSYSLFREIAGKRAGVLHPGAAAPEAKAEDAGGEAK